MSICFHTIYLLIFYAIHFPYKGTLAMCVHKIKHTGKKKKIGQTTNVSASSSLRGHVQWFSVGS